MLAICILVASFYFSSLTWGCKTFSGWKLLGCLFPLQQQIHVFLSQSQSLIQILSPNARGCYFPDDRLSERKKMACPWCHFRQMIYFCLPLWTSLAFVLWKRQFLWLHSSRSKTRDVFPPLVSFSSTFLSNKERVHFALLHCNGAEAALCLGTLPGCVYVNK